MKLTPALRKMLEAIRDQDGATITSMKAANRLRNKLMALGLIRWNINTKVGRELTDKGIEALSN